MCKEYRIPTYSILTGILITLITAFFPNIFLFRDVYRGYLLPWIKNSEILWAGLLVNVIIWSVLIYLSLISIEKEKVRPAKKKPAKKRKR